MIALKQLNFLSYLVDFGDQFGQVAARGAARELTSDGGLVIGAYWDDIPCALAVLHKAYGGRLELVHLSVLDGYRRRGVGSALLTECVRLAAASGSPELRLWLNPDSEFDYHLHNRLQDIGFAARPQMITTVIWVAKSLADWETFINGRGARKIGALTDAGYSAVSFADASAELLEALYSRKGRSYPPFLDPRLGEETRLDRSSFVAVRDGQPTAFCMMSSIDNGRSAVLESLAAMSEDQGSGAFLLCVISAVNSLIANGCNKLAYAYSPNNETLPNIVTGKDWFPTKKATQMYEYSLVFKEPSDQTQPASPCTSEA